ncbi:hypothetical protein C4Q31_15065 [Leptospira borgpetersenii serovar Ceylonica]|nr:Uncharacterized protein LB4E_1842 [Leptospira borgpetersenii str. 4E]AXX16690.1 hypothetical protein C4Q31_15065 [Leptospira borgpetersenii serovar Ceylonica]EMN18010.1 hypothetical protein LEP1GSC056_0365 [Leptospira borgpetersenii str. Brem 328]OOV44386.1 hypothetical protein B1H38_09050 [Leptospira borgpetersenii serovar Ballum]PTM44273.1 hypothetical protein CLV95_1136 [Leptospira borgpetersenii serovar Javanica]
MTPNCRAQLHQRKTMSGFSKEVQCDSLGRYFLISFRQSQYVFRGVIFEKSKSDQTHAIEQYSLTNFLHGFI